jgi:hypothetical protein
MDVTKSYQWLPWFRKNLCWHRPFIEWM